MIETPGSLEHWELAIGMDRLSHGDHWGKVRYSLSINVDSRRKWAVVYTLELAQNKRESQDLET
jgi:hypothetical protein